MRRKHRRIVIGSVIGICLSLFSVTLAAAAYDWSAVDARLQQATTNGESPAGVSMMITRGSTAGTVYEKAFGTAWNTSEKINIESATKWIVGATLMTLVDAGKLSLDDLVTKYIPGFAQFDAQKAEITIRQLLSHTSGLAREYVCEFVGVSLDDCVQLIEVHPSDYPPGQDFSYGGGSMEVAADVAQIVSGESFTQLVADKITTPCGMDFAYNSASNPWVAGGGITTMESYDKFLGIFRNGGYCGSTQVLSTTAIQTMFSDQTRGAVIANSPYKDGRRYGIGVWIDKVDSSGNTTEVGSLGLTGVQPWYDLTRNYSGVIFQESSYVEVMKTFDAVDPLVEAQIDANP